jgi:hypothetical protein
MMKEQPMRIARYTSIALVLAALVLIASAALSSRPAAAGADLSGTWDATYSLSCDATFSQTGMTVSADIDCGGDLAGTLTGTVDANNAFSLSGMFGAIPLTVDGTVSSDRQTMTGTWSAPPIVPSGTFSAVREMSGAMDLTGDWTITVDDVFAGTCAVVIAQSGTGLSASAECNGRPFGTFEGTFDPDTGAMEMDGPFGEFAGIAISATVDEDGATFSGTWRITPNGPRGIIEGQLREFPEEEETPTPRTTHPRSPTPTAAAGALPSAGSGGGDPGGLPWLLLGGAAALFAAATASCAAGRRLRSIR